MRSLKIIGAALLAAALLSGCGPRQTEGSDSQYGKRMCTAPSSITPATSLAEAKARLDEATQQLAVVQDLAWPIHNKSYHFSGYIAGCDTNVQLALAEYTAWRTAELVAKQQAAPK